uniref:Putative CMP/dCMP deaminase zinc-binding n=2 Tax=viral metagenome TaxID=1070528 RepID=A0A6M3XH41_9ZZZZ
MNEAKDRSSIIPKGVIDISEGNKEIAVRLALQARKNAILIRNNHTRVGACVYTRNGCFYTGFNIQNYCHKSYHAEETAILNYLLSCTSPIDNIIGIVISFSDNDIKRLTFMCGHCRQIVWDHTRNPDLLVTEVDLEGNIIKEIKLKELYPYPYPRD